MNLLNLSKAEINDHLKNLEAAELIDLQRSLLTQFLVLGNQGENVDLTILRKIQYVTKLVTKNIEKNFVPTQSVARTR